MKKKLHRYPNLVLNNRGVGIATVVIVVAFLIVLGSVILFSSYNSVRKSTAAKEGNELFYDAESALNQIQAGLQLSLSKSFKTAYDLVMADYSKESTDKFFDTFKSELAKNNANVIDFTNNTYSLSGLKAFLTEDFQQYTTVSTSDATATSGTLVIDTTSKPNTATLEDVRVSVTKDGRSSSITADLVMTVPTIDYVDTGYNLTSVNAFSLIAQEEIKVFSATKSPTLTGNVYTGEVNITGKTLTLTDGMLICANDLTVENATFCLKKGTTLWANNLIANNSGILTLEGDSFVANDLNLKGNNSRATLKGRYIGYGNSTTNAEESSAIYANGKNTKLIMTSELDYFMLAGYSFIDLSAQNGASDSKQTTTNADLRMGESITARSNQQLYLVPAESIRYYDEGTLASVPSNPVVTSEGEAAKMLRSTIRTTDPLLTGANIEVSAQKVGDQWVVYFFMQFTDPEEANDYFINYFTDKDNTADAAKMNTYLNSYISVAKKTDSILTAGAAFTNAKYDTETKTKSGTLKLFNQSTIYANNEWKSTFDNLTKTLTSYSVETDEDTPYNYYINSDKNLWELVTEAGGELYFYSDGKKVGVVTNKETYTYNFNDENSVIRVIIASGNVVMNNPDSKFKGMIVANGTVDLSKSIGIESKPSSVSKVLTRVAKINNATVKYQDKDLTLAKFLNADLVPDDNDGSQSSSTATQNYDVVVSVENWRVA